MRKVAFKKYLLTCGVAVVAAGALGLIGAQSAFAQEITATDGAIVKAVKAGKSVSRYDFNGDGVGDAVSFATDEVDSDGYYTALDLHIGDASLNLIKDGYFYSPKVTIVVLDTGKKYIPYVNVTAAADNDYLSVSALYELQDGKIVKALDCKNPNIVLGDRYSHGTNNALESVSGKNLKIACSTQPYACGILSYSYTFTNANGSLVRTNASATAKATFAKDGKAIAYATATKAFKLYKSTACTSSYAVKKGAKITVKGVYLNEKDKLIKVKVKGGKTGYINAKSYKSTTGPLFKEAVFAG